MYRCNSLKMLSPFFGLTFLSITSCPSYVIHHTYTGFHILKWRYSHTRSHTFKNNNEQQDTQTVASWLLLSYEHLSPIAKSIILLLYNHRVCMYGSCPASGTKKYSSNFMYSTRRFYPFEESVKEYNSADSTNYVHNLLWQSKGTTQILQANKGLRITLWRSYV